MPAVAKPSAVQNQCMIIKSNLPEKADEANDLALSAFMIELVQLKLNQSTQQFFSVLLTYCVG